MLKSLILSAFIVLLWAVVVLRLLQARRPKAPLNLMVVAFLPAVPVFSLAYWLVPQNLGFLPTGLSATPVLLELFDGLLILTLFFLTGVQFYYHFHNSITLRLLAELKRSPGEFMTIAELDAVSSVPILMEARLYALERARLLRCRDGRYYPTLGGRLVAALTVLTHAILKLRV